MNLQKKSTFVCFKWCHEGYRTHLAPYGKFAPSLVTLKGLPGGHRGGVEYCIEMPAIRAKQLWHRG